MGFGTWSCGSSWAWRRSRRGRKPEFGHASECLGVQTSDFSAVFPEGLRSRFGVQRLEGKELKIE
eukprot:2316270-Rhodomonas_salina.1